MKSETHDTVKIPQSITISESPEFLSYIVIGLFDNFKGISKALFVTDSSTTIENDLNANNFKLQEYFYEAYHFETLNSAIKVANNYYTYYGTHSQLFAIYGLSHNGKKPKLVWYQDGYFDYLTQTKKKYENNWFYGIIKYSKLRSSFDIDKAPIIFHGQGIMSSLGIFPRDRIVSEANWHDGQSKLDMLYKLEKFSAFDTLVSRLSRIYTQYEKDKYEEEKVLKLSKRKKVLLAGATESFDLSQSVKNEQDAPDWIKSIARYGRND